MVKTDFHKPYTKVTRTVKGKKVSTYKTTFPERDRPGVYEIQKAGKIVYVGYSSNNLYRTLYRHFQKWNHPIQDVVTYDPDTVKVAVTYCKPDEAKALEVALIKEHNPPDNTLKKKLMGRAGKYSAGMLKKHMSLDIFATPEKRTEYKPEDVPF